MIDAKDCIGSHNLVFITFDTLRYDVAEQAMKQHRTPFLKELLPNSTWEKRQTPATFTYAAHHAFFSGYLPTPLPKPDDYQRLFACSFEGSSTTGETTWVTQHSNIIQGLQAENYHTICIGGVGFFNKQNALGNVLPDLFMESHWSPDLGVTNPNSTQHQVTLACERLTSLKHDQRFSLFINLSAMHQPNCIFGSVDSVGQAATEDSPTTQLDALAYVDSQLSPLFDQLRISGDSLCILSSDHGTTYGEDGVWGHGVAHPSVWEVPYCEFILEGKHD